MVAHVLQAEAAPQIVKIGAERLAAGDRHNAREMFLGALNCDINAVGAWQGLAALAVGPDRYAASIALGRRALALDPGSYSLKVNLGNALWRAQHFAESEALLLEALAARPEEAACHQNIALLYYSTGRAELAVAHIEKALGSLPDSAALRGDHAHMVLKTGDLARGLELLEVRWEGLLAKNPIWECGLPKWDGGKIAGSRVLLLHHEQGFGDTIQFVRFIPAIREAAGAERVIFACPKALMPLLAGQCGIDEVISDSDAGPIVNAARRAAYHCPLVSAVAVLRPSYDPDGVFENGVRVQVARIDGVDCSHEIKPAPYLKAPAPTDRKFHFGGAKLAIGVCWGASMTPERGSQKSVRVEELLDLGSLPGVRLWSLQFGPHADELAPTAADILIQPVHGGLGDFADTAAVIDKLDLVVSIDTATAHLAGALGKPVFMLNPINPCWRWLHGPAPWYSTMRIFDQVEAGNWAAPIAAIKREIEEMLAVKAALEQAA